MYLIEKEQLKIEIQHIFDSGANEIRIFEMVKSFIESRPTITNPEKLSIRDEFAAKAMQGISSTLSGQEEVIYVHQIAKDAYAMADAMLKEREL